MPRELTTSLQNPNPHELKAKVLRGLADPSRLAVLECLLMQPRCVSQIVELSGLSQPNVSNHLACLRDCGLVEGEQRGRFVFYRLTDPSTALLLEELNQVVASIGHYLNDCPNYSTGRIRELGVTNDTTRKTR